MCTYALQALLGKGHRSADEREGQGWCASCLSVRGLRVSVQHGRPWTNFVDEQLE